jgi:hypothetical protein
MDLPELSQCHNYALSVTHFDFASMRKTVLANAKLDFSIFKNAELKGGGYDRGYHCRRKNYRVSKEQNYFLNLDEAGKPTLFRITIIQTRIIGAE